jgi:hypothetical protein
MTPKFRGALGLRRGNSAFQGCIDGAAAAPAERAAAQRSRRMRQSHATALQLSFAVLHLLFHLLESAL